MEPLKSIIAWLLSPLIIGLALQLTGMMLHRPGKPRPARVLLVLGTVVLILTAFPALAVSANRQREQSHPSFEPAALSHPGEPALVVVLGTGFNPDPHIPPTARLDSVLSARLLEGVRIHRLLPNSRLLVSLSGDAGTPDEKHRTLDELADVLALDPARLHLLTEAESTLDEARMTAQQRRPGETIIIATSAGHMPRAMKIFATLGLDPIAAPTDFKHPRPGTPADRTWKRWIPSIDGHRETQQWLYETSAAIAARLGI